MTLLLAGAGKGTPGLSPPPAVSSYWNPADKNANIILSNADKSIAGGSGVQSIRGITAHSSGKKHLEYYIDRSFGTVSFGIGFANASASLSNFIGVDFNGLMFFSEDEKIYVNGAGTAYPGGIIISSPPQAIGMTYDLTNRKLYISINGAYVSGGDPVAGTNGYSVSASVTGPLFPAASYFGPSGPIITLRTDAADFSTPAPSGYPAWG